MTFPNDHRYPGGLPAFKVAGHGFSHIGVAEDIEFERGEDRGRQIYTVNPQLVAVATRLTQAQFDRLGEWFENDLLAGASRFDAQVAEQGGSPGAFTAWWQAQFVGPYRWEARSGGRYEVTAELLLLDGPYATRVAPTLRGSMTLRTRLTARLVNDGVLRGSMTLSTRLTASPTLPTLRGSMTLTTRLTAFLGDTTDRLLEDGQGRLNEPGVARTTE